VEEEKEQVDIKKEFKIEETPDKSCDKDKRPEPKASIFSKLFSCCLKKKD
jgi:hypothetical protein